MNGHKYSFSIELKSGEYLNVLATNCDQKKPGLFIKVSLVNLVLYYWKMRATKSRMNSTLLLDINRKDLKQALLKKRRSVSNP